MRLALGASVDSFNTQLKLQRTDCLPRFATGACSGDLSVFLGYMSPLDNLKQVENLLYSRLSTVYRKIETDYQGLLVKNSLIVELPVEEGGQ